MHDVDLPAEPDRAARSGGGCASAEAFAAERPARVRPASLDRPHHSEDQRRPSPFVDHEGCNVYGASAQSPGRRSVLYSDVATGSTVLEGVRRAHRLVYTARPLAFFIVALYGVSFSRRETFNWRSGGDDRPHGS